MVCCSIKVGPYASHLVHTQHDYAQPCSYTSQTMDRLKLLLTEEGINFTDTTFNTENGIRGLGEKPFVSEVVFPASDLPYTLLC